MTAGGRARHYGLAGRRLLGLLRRGRFDLAVEKVLRRWQGAPLRRITVTGFWRRIEDCQQLVLFIDAGLGGGASAHAAREIDALHADGATVLQVSVHGLSGGTVVSSTTLGLRHAVSLAVPQLLSDARLESRLLQIRVGTLVGFEAPLALLRALVELQRRTAVPLVVDWHDHYLICPSHLLLDYTGRYCAIPAAERCDSCIRRHPAAAEDAVRRGGIAVWREACAAFLDAAATVRVFSCSSRTLLQRAYGARFDDRLLLSGHAMDYFSAARRVTAVESPLTIAVLGRINFHKGARVIERLAAEIKRQEAEASIVVVGTIDASPDPDVVAVYGAYEVNELPDILEALNVSLVFVPSVCPETFSYVVHEVMAMELPLFTLPLGAQAESAAAYARGAVASSEEPRVLLEEMRELVASQSGTGR